VAALMNTIAAVSRTMRSRSGDGTPVRACFIRSIPAGRRVQQHGAFRVLQKNRFHRKFCLYFRKRMNIGLTTSQRILIVFVCFAVAVIGFMMKLPSGFRHIDKELHATFYFLAAAFLNILFARTKLVRHVIIFIALYVFGMAIEYGQAYSNKFFRSRIHGRFDPEDIQWNLKGLIAFSILWLICTVIILIYKATLKSDTYDSKAS
jgi:hypothetical protein